ncbi:MAG: hypothetical protein CM1200mP3_15990 [Chloroflexota bacterium]|nr:MAG: hypothetical protein CM1200mP3_15990 [Chloroflexota bacterium]
MDVALEETDLSETELIEILNPESMTEPGSLGCNRLAISKSFSGSSSWATLTDYCMIQCRIPQ